MPLRDAQTCGASFRHCRRLRAVALGVSRTLVGGLLLIAEPAAAQWLKHPSPGIPRTKDGKANLAAPSPTLRNGRPDLSGIWQAEPDPQGSPEGCKWEGRTLVVDSVGFKDRGWLDRMGHPHSDALHLVERFTRRDFGHMGIAMTIDDPKTYTQPFSYTQRAVLLPDTDLIEYHCSENEKDIPHYK